MPLRQIFDKKVTSECKPKKILKNLLTRRLFGLDQKSVALPQYADNGQQAALGVRKCGQHLVTVFERLHVVRDHPVQKLHGFLSPNGDQPAFLFVKAGAAETDVVIGFKIIHLI